MNLWADKISRWHSHSRDIIAMAAVQTRSHHVAPVESLSMLRPLADDRTATVTRRPWIPNAAKDLLARFFIVAHCGSQGYRGQDGMLSTIDRRFYISQLADKVAKFMSECLLCKRVKGPRLLPRPYGSLMTATRHEMRPFIGTNELSHFCALVPCATPTSFVAAEALAMWCARFGVPETLLSDQGSHFRNEMIKHLCARLKIEQAFSPVYMPWLNDTVERLNRDVLQVMEYGIDQHEWPYLLPSLEANLNHTPVQSLHGHYLV
ncbi:Hypothetical protein PHPALM_17041 [Phytophthora palmivora]|uniref:Integrase catalytic domain-containing protein n=1 Tax=Phytophthora palmivora TaxID=4796 RepID=A0A2P4XNB7_9STRA|nr:Hypothetical protein PHPALM_17041 [Phytophthora palmivora]